MLSVKDLFRSQRFAFSLLELMIVIFIISFAYLLIFSSMKKAQEKPKALQVSNLRSLLLSGELRYSDSEFFCIDKSKSCYIYKDGETDKYEEDIALGDLSVYYLDDEESLQEFDFGRYHDRRVSLRFKTYHNGSSSQMIIKSREGIYYLPSFFGKSTKVDSLDKGKEMWIANKERLEDSGEYY